MAKGRYRLTNGDIEIFKKASNPRDGIGANWFTKYYFQREFKQWQWVMHHAPQPDITVLGGVGSGKTVGTALSAATYAATTPRFAFMNLAPTSWQSKLMYDAIIREADGKPFERFIYKAVERPYPKIILRSDYIGESTLQFFSASDEATRIQGWEGDYINLDEAGLITHADQLLGMIASRLRGTVIMPGGGLRNRLSRLGMITASYIEAPPWLWNRMDAMHSDPENFLSMTVTSEEAGTLTKKDIENYRRRIPMDQQAILLDAARPEGTGDHFKLASVNACEDWTLNRHIQYHLLEKETPTPGWAYEEVQGAGCIHFEMPPERGRQYLLVGDPGQGSPPLRNAGAIWILDITEFPKKPAVLRYFDWVNGHGSYTPFKTSYKYAWDTYRPIAALIDSTGTQSLWNEQVLLDLGIWAEGMDFNGKKQGMLVAAMQMVQRQLISFPFIQGLRSQLVNYSIDKDKKLAQDLVVLLLMSAFYLRSFLWRDYVEVADGDAGEIEYSSARDVRASSVRSVRRRVNSNGIISVDIGG